MDKKTIKAIEILENIIELTEFKGLFRKGIEFDISELAKYAIETLKGV